MATHLMKLSLQNSDMFISSIDFTKSEISYQIRDKETGNLLEPIKTSKFTKDGIKIYFDSRFIDLKLSEYINHTLL